MGLHPLRVITRAEKSSTTSGQDGAEDKNIYLDSPEEWDADKNAQQGIGKREDDQNALTEFMKHSALRFFEVQIQVNPDCIIAFVDT